jgi:1,2-diacylglycerol 3-alpha-glucosyltransferase
MNFEPRVWDPQASAATTPDSRPQPEMGWLRRVAIANDYVRIPYANGSSFASQFLFRALESRGHEVTIVGPAERQSETTQVGAMPPRYLCLASVPLRTHPGVNLALPSRSRLLALRDGQFDMVLAQTCSALLKAGVWLRQERGVPLVAVNTVHLPSVYNVVLPDWLNERAWVHDFFQESVVPWVERATAHTYNRGDGLVVLSYGLKRYWEQRGVEVPIHVIPVPSRSASSTITAEGIRSTRGRPGAHACWWCAGMSARRTSNSSSTSSPARWSQRTETPR